MLEKINNLLNRFLYWMDNDRGLDKLLTITMLGIGLGTVIAFVLIAILSILVILGVR